MEDKILSIKYIVMLQMRRPHIFAKKKETYAVYEVKTVETWTDLSNGNGWGCYGPSYTKDKFIKRFNNVDDALKLRDTLVSLFESNK